MKLPWHEAGRLSGGCRGGEQGEIWYDATVQQHDEHSGERTAGRPWSDTWQAGQRKTLERNVGARRRKKKQSGGIWKVESNSGCGGSSRRLRVVSEVAQADGTVYLNASR